MSATKPTALTSPAEPVTAVSPATLSIGDAARLLGVSIKTIRRWEADGRISPVRTEGGHRRFSLASLTQLHGKTRARGAPVSQLRTAALPSRPLPALARLLRTRLDPVLMRTTRHIYGEHRPGWFRSAGASPHLGAFAGQLATGAEAGDWELVKTATAMLIIRAAAADDGPTYQETFMFLRVLRAALIAELRLQDDSVPIELTKLFDAVEHETARNAGRFFEAGASGIRPLTEAETGAPWIPIKARTAAAQACETLAGMPACCGALVLAGRPASDTLDVICSAGLEVASDPRFTLSEDPLSSALRDQKTTFVRSTIAARRLPLATSPSHCLPLVASGQPSAELRLGIVVLVRSGADVDSRLLEPLADLKGRLASMAAGIGSDASTEGALESDLERLAIYLGPAGRAQSVSIRARAS